MQYDFLIMVFCDLIKIKKTTSIFQCSTLELYSRTLAFIFLEEPEKNLIVQIHVNVYLFKTAYFS